MRSRSVLAAVLSLFFMIGLFGDFGSQPGGAPAQPAPARKIVVFQENYVNAPAQDALVRGAGGTVIKRLTLINGMAVLLPAQAVQALAARAEVRRIDEDLTITATGAAAPPVALGAKAKPTPPPSQTVPWGIIRIGAPDAWAYSTGAYVKVAIMDSGIQLDHPDLAANIAGGVNTINPNKSATDDNGHGTHVAGTVAAVNNSIGVVGAAHQAKLYAVKVLDRNGNGWLSDLIEGLQWCIGNQMDVVNMSLGSTSDNQSFHDAIIAAYQAGIVQVAAAGNNGGGYGTGTGLVDYPGRYEEVIAVSASDSSDRFAVFSSAGPEVDLIAPGANITSTYKGSAYKALSGTSMATPHVAAVAALRLQLHPTETPDAVKAALQSNAVNLGLPATQQGAGLVNAFAVVIAP